MFEVEFTLIALSEYLVIGYITELWNYFNLTLSKFVRGAESILKANPWSSSLQPFEYLPDEDLKSELESVET